MKKTVVLFLVLISILTLSIRFGGRLAQDFFGLKKTSGIIVQSVPDGAEVFLDGVKVGETPLEEDSLVPKEYDIKLQKDQKKTEKKRIFFEPPENAVSFFLN